MVDASLVAMAGTTATGKKEKSQVRCMAMRIPAAAFVGPPEERAILSVCPRRCAKVLGGGRRELLPTCCELCCEHLFKTCILLCRAAQVGTVLAPCWSMLAPCWFNVGRFEHCLTVLVCFYHHLSFRHPALQSVCRQMLDTRVEQKHSIPRSHAEPSEGS